MGWTDAKADLSNPSRTLCTHGRDSNSTGKRSEPDPERRVYCTKRPPDFNIEITHHQQNYIGAYK